MSTLTANLKHYYQRPAMWVVYGFFPLFIVSMACIGGLGRGHRGVGFVLGLMVDLLFAPYLGLLPKDVLAKPFAFCLPGHRDVSRRVVLIVAVVVNLVLAGLLMIGLEGYPFGLVVGFLSIFSAGLAVFHVATVLDFRTRWYRCLGGAWVLVPLFMASDLRDVLNNGIEKFVLSNPVLRVGACSSLASVGRGSRSRRG